MGDILVGTSSWADRSLLSAGWYPRGANTPAGRLAYYAERFPLVEVDTTYYAIPAPETAVAWVDRTPASFTFNVKAFSLLTGHPTPVSALPADLRPATRRTQVRRSDLPPDTVDAIWARFRSVVDPIAAAGKLGVVLLQFPPWLAHGDAAKARIAEVARRCAPLPVAVEFRHGSWFTAGHALDTMEFLHGNGLSFCCVDMPQGHPSSVPPVLVATADPAVVRFHGHSPAWATGDKQDRFRYDYSDEELAAWVPRLRRLADEVDRLHVLMNTCCGDQAVRSATRLAELVHGPARLPQGRAVPRQRPTQSVSR